MDTSQRVDPATESFRGLLLRHRGRAGLTQRELATRLGAARRTLQDWEAGVNHPGAERLQTLIHELFEAGGLTFGREAAEARELWAAVEREAPRMHTPLDEVWLADALARRAAPEAADLPPGVSTSEAGVIERLQDWGDAPDVIGFVGRVDELATLREWLLADRCRLVAMLGIGGIGKTALASRLAQDAAPRFQRVYWRSLRDALPVGEWLAGALGFLSAHQVVPPEGDSARFALLLQLLRDRPSLLVVDNFETVLEPGEREGRYRQGFEGYGALLRALGETRHQSCLVVTSREAPPELAVLGGGGSVRRLQLGGLGIPEGQVLLADKQLSGNDQDWTKLITRFGGNGLALKVVGESIRQVFDGDIAAFLEQPGSTSSFGGMRRLLAEQIERSSELELKLLRVLAVQREAVRVGELITDLGARVRQATVLEAVEALRRRSLVERAGTAGMAAFTLQSVVLEYVTDRLVEDVADEIGRGQPLLLVEQPLIKAQAKDYVRQSQERLIGAPILQLLTPHYGKDGTQQRLLALLDTWRGRTEAEQGYGPGNVVNLLRLQRGDLRALDLSRVVIRQAYLAEVDAQDSSLVDAHLAEAILADVFSLPLSVALSGDGEFLAAGTSTGEVWLWRVGDRTLLARFAGHTGSVRSVALSADGQLLVSGSEDGTLRLWETSTRRVLAILDGHTGQVWGVALSARGHLLASASEDGTIHLWEAPLGEASAAGHTRPLAVLHGHTGAVWSVALSADGQRLASGGFDGTVRVWSPASQGAWRLVATLEGHSSAVWGVALRADGRLLASGSGDGTIRMWSLTGLAERGGMPGIQEASTGRMLAVLQGHTSGVWAVSLSADGRLLASGSGDGTARLWEATTGRLLATLHGHTSVVRGATLSADGQLLASAGFDGAVRLWEATTARPLATLLGQTDGVRALALATDGELLASGSLDGTLRVWSLTGLGERDRMPGIQEAARTSRVLTALQGHTGTVRGVTLSADARQLASSGEDGSVRLWDPGTGQLLATLQGHTGGVWAVALSADGRVLASGGADGSLRLWEASTGRLLAAMQGHSSGVWSVALSADGRLLASGGGDGAVRLWDAATGQLLTTFAGHTGAIWSVALSPDGRLLASGGGDGTARLWEATTGQLLTTVQGHTGAVWSVALAADGRLLATGGGYGTVQLWSLTGVAERDQMRGIQEEARTGQPMATLHGHTGGVWALALSAESHVLASGSEDGAVRLWDTTSGTCLATLRSDRRYERADITGLTGMTAAQRAALLALGAVEHFGISGPDAAPVTMNTVSPGRNAPITP
jgi:WD40 repeat protein/transcriptional regulator with XRE-family HTH domain